MMPPTPIQDALYYPYIRIRDINWLKSTLLCFPQVRRMIPDFYVVQDSDEIRPFLEENGPHGPLLTASQTLNSGVVASAVQRLTTWADQHRDELIAQYSQALTEQHYAPDELFQIHARKISIGLLELLKHEQLGWHARSGPDRDEWMAMHPRLGRAIMSIIARTIAEYDGLSTVTPSADSHYRIGSQTEQEILNAILSDSLAVPPAPPQVVDELVEIVLVSTFEFQNLTASQIGELLREGQDLHTFKQKAAEFAAMVPSIPNPKERKQRLEELAETIRVDWQRQKRSMPRFALDALFEAADVNLPSCLPLLVASASSELSTFAFGGLVLAMITHKAAKVFGTYRSHANTPYRFLTRIHEAGATFRSQPTDLKLLMR
jgi:hypothetical protein